MSGEPMLMPAAFLGHGSPMNALERNGYTETWRAFGSSVPRPRAILVISAHWFINATAVTSHVGKPMPLLVLNAQAGIGQVKLIRST